MDDSLNSSTPGLNITSRPSRARKKRNFGDFVVDLGENSEESYVTSTPLLPVAKKRRSSSSTLDKLNSSVPSRIDEISNSSIVTSEIDNDEKLVSESKNMSLSRNELGNESGDLSMNETGDGPSRSSRGRGRPRKTEVSHTAKSNISCNLSPSIDSNKDCSVDFSEIVGMDSGGNLSEGNTQMKRGRGRPRGRPRNNLKSTSRLDDTTKEDNENDALEKESADSSKLADDKSVVQFGEEKTRMNSVRGRGRGRPRKLPTAPLNTSCDITNEDSDTSFNDTKDEQLDHSKLLGTDRLNEELEVSADSSKLENGKSDVQFGEEKTRMNSARGRGRPKGRPRKLPTAPLNISYDTTNEDSVTSFNDTKDEKLGHSYDASLNSSFIANKDGDAGEPDGTQRRSRRTPKSRNFLLDDSSNFESGTDEEEDDDVAFIAPSSVRSRRGRGRGRCRGAGRGRGRGRGLGKSSRSDSDSNEDTSDDNEQDYQPSPKGGRGKAVKQFNCSHCDEVFENRSKFEYHLMSKHSLVSTKQFPQGEDYPKLIINKVGFITCQKCQKKLKNPQYYKHHIEWCGRETELFLCHVCKKNTKKMWEYQHMQYHKVQEQKKEEASMKEMKVQQEREREEKGEQSEDKKKRRQAAKSAMTLINSLDQGEENDPGTKKKKKKKDEDSDGVIDINSNDEDEDDEDIDAEIDEEEDEENDDDVDDEDNPQINKDKKKQSRKRAKTGKPISKKTFDELYSNTSVSEKELLWRILSCYEVQETSYKYVTHFYNELKKLKSLFLFEDLMPRRSEWTPLRDSDAVNYLPPLKHSTPFTSVPKGGDPVEPVTLSFGQSAEVNGKLFSFTGGPIWAMEWCPLPLASGHHDVLALVADRETKPSCGMATLLSGPSLIQFWTMQGDKPATLSFGIAHDSGSVRSIMWCPSGGFSPKTQKEEDVESMDKDNRPLERLGLLAVACSDSSILIYSIPQFSSLFPSQPTGNSEDASTNNHHQHQPQNSQLPVVFRPSPSVKLVFNSLASASRCLSVSWQGGDKCQYILGGFGCGQIAMWDLVSTSSFIQVDANTRRPARVFRRHDMSVLSVSWCPSLPTQFVSCGFEGFIHLWDKDRPYEPIATLPNVVRGPIRAGCWASPFHAGFFSVNDRRTIVFGSGKRNFYLCFHGLAMHSIGNSDLHTPVGQHPAAIWDVNFQPLYEIMASCDAIGNILINLPRMEAIRRTKKLVFNNMPHCVIHMLLYRIKTEQNSLPETHKTSEGDNNPSNDNVDQPTDQSTESISTTTNEIPDPEQDSTPPSQKQPITDSVECLTTTKEKSSPTKGGKNDSQQVLYFNECDQNPDELNTVPSGSSNFKMSMNDEDDLGASNISAVHRVRLRPSFSENIWLASGGQAGLLRLDNLTPWVAPRRRDIYDELKNVLV